MKSVGEYLAPETSVNSVNSVGGLAEGGVGMAGMPYPPTIDPWEGRKRKEGMAECHALL